MIIKNNYSLLSHNTFGLSVYADLFVEYDHVTELISFIKEKNLSETKFLHIGQGSNLLFVTDFHGIILHAKLTEIEQIKETDSDIYIRVGSGVIWDDFVIYCIKNNFYGSENLSLIPGEVGASAIQNIGAYGAEVKDIIYEVETVSTIDGTPHNFTNEACRYAYRSSIFKQEYKNLYIVTYVTFRLSKKPTFNMEYGVLKDCFNNETGITLQAVRDKVIETRESKLPDPAVVGNAGSFFMNPVINETLFLNIKASYPNVPFYYISGDEIKIPAGWLIEQCGWKGKCINNACVHEKQALVLINKGGAAASDIIKLAQSIQASVKQNFGINLTPEVNFIS